MNEEEDQQQKGLTNRNTYGRIKIPRHDDSQLRDYCAKKRLLNGWTYAYVGRQVRQRNGKPYSRMNIYNWITGRIHFGPEYSFKMAEAFRVHPLYAAFLMRRFPDYEFIGDYPDEAEVVKYMIDGMKRFGYKVKPEDKKREII
jgi:hypothetical protein